MTGVRNWFGPVRLAFTLLGLPGIRSSIVCALSLFSTNYRTITTNASSLCVSSTITMHSLALHIKSRCPQYPGSNVQRYPVPDDKVDWTTSWSQYTPASYTAPCVAKKPNWADPEIGLFSPQFNTLDGSVDRMSHEGDYPVEEGKPLNPHGRTGLIERGLLGRWGPNHAADPIVTRWKRDPAGQQVSHPVTKLPVLQFVSIKRKDSGEWAIPGGMVDPGELVSYTLQREFSEEALNSLAASPAERKQIYQSISQLFSLHGLQVYKGYVDDPRNTDNSWMETVAVNFHDETGNSVSEIPLQAGDDAGQVHWIEIDSALPLYASHSHFLELVTKTRHAHW
ncbi:ADP-ribose pyrophosphatase, mitochondrial isoform X1 [Hypomesus transpacificus]|uniref:ADP-ribose pyrophosphatase, mitochondrial isoform X1 n=1 Tax=Hypomesus transpacificus TaxID=137520 RepID=UPI001F07D071|nr:ADP-ribose pyrophosphatase, mitochondrial isoform X1 [Hypomesus transpacificus]